MTQTEDDFLCATARLLQAVEAWEKAAPEEITGLNDDFTAAAQGVCERAARLKQAILALSHQAMLRRA